VHIEVVEVENFQQKKMGRFESPLQVAGLFFCATFVSVGLIFFINAEAQSRQSRLENRHPPTSK